MTHDLTPLVVQAIFLRIPDEDCLLLNLDVQRRSRPEDMLIRQFLVPPACIRPSVAMGTSGSNEDDLTVKIADIIFINNAIKNAIEKGAQPSVIMENWDFLQQQVSMYCNSDLPGFPKALGSKPIRALIQRLKGKTGRFRGNLSGKRVDFSSRTVISPDPNLGVHEVGVPVLVAKILTYPERVHAHNIEKLRKAILNGPDIHPGANIVEYSSGAKVFLRYGDRNLVASKLKYGDLVERHLENGDVCLFNRQPSLHKLSIMAHRARVLQWRTFRFNESVCTPYNADFDGDEMNLHLPQTEEARTEALLLMGVRENLVTPRHGEPLITATQDFITTNYLITQKDVFYDKIQFQQICCFMGDALEQIDMPIPAICKPMRLWTGKQVFGMLIRPNKSLLPDGITPRWPIVNVELKEKNFTSNGIMCPKDGYVVFRDSELMCGNICKPTVGGDKSGLLYILLREFSSNAAATLLNRVAKLSARWIGDRGFSIGIDDVTPTNKVNYVKSKLLEKGYSTCDDKISLFKRGKLPPMSGCNEEQTLESLLLGELSQIREDAGAVCLKELDQNHCAPLIMAVCGSKGSKINISQMVACQYLCKQYFLRMNC
jgi:DNA-directed RNA polymerase III subunit RPC1